MTSDVAAATFGKTYSVFSQDNLMPSMNFIDEWEKSGLSSREFEYWKPLVFLVPENMYLLTSS